MSGYAKRMMEAAKPWMEANPIPFAGRILVPRERRLTITADAARKSSELSRYNMAATGTPLVDALVARAAALEVEAAALAAERDSLTAGVARLEDDLEAVLNKCESSPKSSASSLVDEAVLGVALGSWMLSWGHEGYNVFDLSPDFVASLLLTDPASLDVEEFRLPFRGLLLLLPDGFARDAGGGSFTKVHVCSLRNHDGDVLDIVASNGRRILSTSAPADTLTLRGLSAFGDEDEWGVADDDDRRALRTLQHVVLGLAAYTSSVSGAATPRDGGGRHRRATAKVAPIIWDVGRTVRIDPNLVRAARAGSREIALRLKHRHIVRGHYRNQPVGEGRKARKTIWIAPFWKGPADGAAIVHTYKPSVAEPSK